MTSFQSTLGEEAGIAEELAESQRAISIAEFFEKNKQMLGFNSGARGLVTAVKEAVDNALDAAEEAKILPDVYVEIQEADDYYRLIVEDNGPGITKESLPKVFGKLLYGSRFHAREQSRGQQGIGISAAVLYSQLTSGKPAKITSRTEGAAEANYYELIIDTDTNEPEIREEKTTSWDRPHGTRIELEMEANMRARQQLHDYIQHTAVVNPHARIELKEPQEHFKYERATDELPKETEEIRPHPHGVELGNVLKMLKASDSHSVSGFLQSEFTRVGRKTSDNIIDEFRDRYYGREMAWSLPDDDALQQAIDDAVNNKPSDAKATFAEAVVSGLHDAASDGRVAHHQVATAVTNAAGDDDLGTTFGDTVQENVVEAVWRTITGYGLDEEPDRLLDDIRAYADDATSVQKDDAVVVAFADRLAAKFVPEGDADYRNRLTRKQLRDYVDRAADMTEEREDATFGDTARENVVDAVWDGMVTVPDDPPNVKDLAEDRDGTSDLVAAMRVTDIMAPPTSCLSPITSELVEAGLKKVYDAEFYASASRDAEVHAGDPFIAEAGIAYGGELQAEGQADLLRFANRVPLVYKRGGCGITEVVKGIGWRNYNLDQPGGSGIPNGPVVIMVHVASTNVPFTSESKDAVASVEVIQDEIELAIREAARELKSYLKKQRSMRKRQKKQNVLAEILPQMAEKVAHVTGRPQPNIDDAMARIMNNVLVDRETTVDGDTQTVKLVVENHSNTNESPDVTDIVDAEPQDVTDGATVVEMEGEWFIKWTPDVSSGDEAVLEYTVPADASFDLSVSEVEAAKLTVNQ
ncbi:DNA topoisomerase VI subunit B [Haloarchaeobius sp. HME9146]|uniref:DNA topoisomerase VI subunit B n=1 Tax=Haloarchaeobius sp. HME9146 TaxID=2978732 RepID=UPI0021BF53DD|nr:DNA topoisomerase VI subunit B [Haloarchaeobius sp. HME9146]MCT9097217.1 DNA topoisomerase VI subunit B [Haloarchaeobius sp. HME9146]